MKAYRGVVRLVLSGDHDRALERQLVGAAFAPNGFERQPGPDGHGTWVRFPVSKAGMAACMTALWAGLARYDGPAEIAHVWSNFEEVEVDLAKFTGEGGKDDLVDELNALGLNVEAKLI